MMRILRSFLALAGCAALFAGMLTGCSSSQDPNSGSVYGIEAGTAQNNVANTEYTQIAASGSTVLSLNRDTCAILLENRGDGTRCQSNPDTAVIDLERSQFTLTYLNKQGIIRTMNTFSDSVKAGQYRIDDIENGAKITFTCGEYLEELLFPYAIDPENYEALTAQMEEGFSKLYVTSRYKLAKLEDIKTQTEKEALLAKYPTLAEHPLYILKQDKPNVSVRRELHRLFAAVGYDKVAYERDMALVSGSTAQDDPFFTFSVYYTLENGSLKVRIPSDEIWEANGGRLLRLTVLPYMDAPASDIDGQYLLPDGSGSLMNFRNGKPGSGYEVAVYGGDISNQAAEKPVNILPCYLPVIGVIRSDHTLMTQATDGAAIAVVRAVSGGVDSLPQAYFEYSTRPYVRTKLASDGAADGFTKVSQELYKGDITLTFTMYPCGTTYSDLAKVMRQRLFGEENRAFDASPLALNFVGTANESTSLFGISYQKKNVYSTVADVAAVREKLLAQFPQLTVRLSGFINGGMEQQLKSGIKVEGGTIEELRNLIGNDRCYLSVDLHLLRDDSLLDGFRSGRDGAYTLENLLATYKSYNPSTSKIDYGKYRYILSGERIKQAFEQLKSDIADWSNAGIAVNDGAALLGADYSRSHPMNRQQMANVMEEGLASLAKTGRVMVDGASDFSLGSAGAFANVYLTSTKYDICDDSVPFVPMVLCGNVDYFGISMNTVGNDLTSFLHVVETGAGLYYTVTTDEEANFSKTAFDELFSTKYPLWEEQILKRGGEIQTLFSKRGRLIVNHEKLADGVYKTEYDNGFYTIVNYGTDIYEAQGVTVPALGYVTGGDS